VKKAFVEALGSKRVKQELTRGVEMS